MHRPAPGTGDTHELQGRWAVGAVVIDGVRQEDLAPDKRDLLDRSDAGFGGHQTKTIVPFESDRAAVLLQPGHNPEQTTTTWGHQRGDGSVDDGLHEPAGDQLKLSTAPRAKRGRPTSCDTGRQAQDVTLLVLRRQK